MCSNSENGCRWVGELRSLDDHLTTCGYALLSCPNKCMENNEEVRILRRDLDNHLKNKCPNRQYQCPHCKATGKYCDITTTHLDACPKLRLLCPNTKCKAIVLRCDLANHRSKCPFISGNMGQKRTFDTLHQQSKVKLTRRILTLTPMSL